MDDGIRPDRGPHQLGQGFLILAGEDDDIELEAHLRLIDEDKGVAHLGQELFEVLAREAEEDGGAPLLGAGRFDHAIFSFLSPTIQPGGRGISTSCGRHRCSVYGCRLMWSARGTCSCITVSASLKKSRLMYSISGQFGQRVARETET